MALDILSSRIGWSLRQRLESLRSALENERQSFISHWRELADYIFPRRSRFTISEAANRGNIRNTNIIDSTATFAARTLASGMMSGLTSPARPWFRLTVSNPQLREDESVKAYLHEVWQIMNAAFSLSNLYKELPSVYLDCGVFATGCMGVYEDDETVFRCETYPIGSYMLGLDAKRKVRVFMREFPMTVRQIVERWGPEERDSQGKVVWGDSPISTPVQAAWDEQRYDQRVDMIHAVFPNSQYDGVSELSSKKKYAQVYYEKTTDKDQPGKDGVLEKKGFDDFPILAMRWYVQGQDAYGTDSPGMLVLGDVKSLQLGMRRGAQAIDKVTNPPLTGPSSLKTAKVSLVSGDITYHDDLNPINQLRPIHEVDPRVVGVLQAWLQEFKFNINRGFFADLFLMLGSNPALDNLQRTAREIDERHEEKFLALGPVVEQGSDDLLDPLIDRVFNILERRGMLPEPPPVLREPGNGKIKVEYISIMAQAQKMIGVGGIERLASYAAQLAQVSPDALDKFDLDQSMDEYADMLGVPPKVIRSDDEVAELRASRAQAQQEAQRAEQMKNVTQSAKNLAQSPTSGDNALAALLQGTGQGIEAPVPEGMVM